jgi:hypothetical protein
VPIPAQCQYRPSANTGLASLNPQGARPQYASIRYPSGSITNAA